MNSDMTCQETFYDWEYLYMGMTNRAKDCFLKLFMMKPENLTSLIKNMDFEEKIATQETLHLMYENYSSFGYVADRAKRHIVDMQGTTRVSYCVKRHMM